LLCGRRDCFLNFGCAAFAISHNVQNVESSSCGAASSERNPVYPNLPKAVLRLLLFKTEPRYRATWGTTSPLLVLVSGASPSDRPSEDGVKIRQRDNQDVIHIPSICSIMRVILPVARTNTLHAWGDRISSTVLLTLEAQCVEAWSWSILLPCENLARRK
jgi:hypothetical protein